jgi:GNAT superfamily N-acetyltransferase
MSTLTIRDLRPEEGPALGQLLVRVYSQLPGFPSPEEQPGYYRMLSEIGRFAERPGARVLAALLPDDTLVGGVVYFGDMAHYGSGGLAPTLTDCSGIRLLGIAPEHRGVGAGKALTQACIDLARAQGHREVVLHTTQAMRTAWGMYERLGFCRAEELDFQQQALPVFGFRLSLEA